MPGIAPLIFSSFFLLLKILLINGFFLKTLKYLFSGYIDFITSLEKILPLPISINSSSTSNNSYFSIIFFNSLKFNFLFFCLYSFLKSDVPSCLYSSTSLFLINLLILDFALPVIQLSNQLGSGYPLDEVSIFT